MDSHEANLVFLLLCNFCVGPVFEKMGVMGSFPGLSGFQNVVFLSCCEAPKLHMSLVKCIGPQTHRSANSDYCGGRGSVGLSQSLR